MTEAMRGKILLVEEDAGLGGTLRRMLGKAHDVELASSAVEALGQLGAGATFDVIICGLLMPMRFHRALLAAHPDDAAGMIFLNTSTAAKEDRVYLAKLANKRLNKPFEITELKHLISERLASRPRNSR